MAENGDEILMRPDLSAGSGMKFRIKKSILCHQITNSEFSKHQKLIFTVFSLVDFNVFLIFKLFISNKLF